MAKIPPITTLALPRIGYTGVEANHSSPVPSTDHFAESDHAQADDDYNDYTPNIDPNLSGTTVTEDTVSWLAGSMNGWQENDDYREFFNTETWPVSRLQSDYCQKDGDYDDNGGIPLAIGHSRGESMKAPSELYPGVSDEQAGHSGHTGAWFLADAPRRI